MLRPMEASLRTLIRFSLIVLLLLAQATSFAAVSKVGEEDAAPAGFPWNLKFPNGSLTDNADGSYSVAFTPSFGGSSGFLYVSSGTGTVTAMADDQIFVASGATAGAATSIGDCDDSTGNHLNYDTTTNTFSCGTSSSSTNTSGFADNGTKVVQVTSSDSVIVGPSPTELGKVTISADTDEVLLGIKAHTTQTTNLIEAKNSAGSSLFALNGSGNLTLGGTLTVAGSTSNTTFGDGTGATYTISADVSGTDHNIVLGSNVTTFSGNVVVPTETYDATNWNGVNQVPTKDAVRDKIESLSASNGNQILCANSATSNTATFYMGMGGASSTTETVARTASTPLTVTVGNFYAGVQTAAGGADSWTVTVREEGSNTAVTCSMNASATTCNDTTHSFVLDAGNDLSIQWSNDGSSTGTGGQGFCMELTQ